jgi:hypothetical protein
MLGPQVAKAFDRVRWLLEGIQHISQEYGRTNKLHLEGRQRRTLFRIESGSCLYSKYKKD